MIKNKYPLTRIYDLFDQLEVFKCFSKLHYENMWLALQIIEILEQFLPSTKFVYNDNSNNSSIDYFIWGFLKITFRGFVCHLASRQGVSSGMAQPTSSAVYHILSKSGPNKL